jgi:hypothetical protein
LLDGPWEALMGAFYWWRMGGFIWV